MERKNHQDGFYEVVVRLQKGNHMESGFKFQVYDYMDDCVLLFIIFTRFSIRRNGLLLEPTGTKFSSETE